MSKHSLAGGETMFRWLSTIFSLSILAAFSLTACASQPKLIASPPVHLIAGSSNQPHTILCRNRIGSLG
jgi:hypothetical protein